MGLGVGKFYLLATMPKIGNLTRLQLKTGELIEMGARPSQVQGTIQPQYDGKIIGIWYVAGNDHEPEHYDVLAVPTEIFDSLMSMVSGKAPEQVYAMIEAASKKAMAEKRRPSAIRRVYPLGESVVYFHEASLTMIEAFDHFQDRFVDSAMAFEDEDDEEGADAPADAQGSPSPAPATQNGMPLPAAGA